MTRIATCGIVGSDLDLILVWTTQTQGVTSESLYPSQIGFRFGSITVNPATPVSVRMRMQLYKDNGGGVFTFLTQSRAFSISNSTGAFQVREIFSPFDLIDNIYLSYIWTTCDLSPPYLMGLTYDGIPNQFPTGRIFTFNLTPLKDRVTPCSG